MTVRTALAVALAALGASGTAQGATLPAAAPPLVLAPTARLTDYLCAADAPLDALHVVVAGSGDGPFVLAAIGPGCSIVARTRATSAAPWGPLQRVAPAGALATGLSAAIAPGGGVIAWSRSGRLEGAAIAADGTVGPAETVAADPDAVPYPAVGAAGTPLVVFGQRALQVATRTASGWSIAQPTVTTSSPVAAAADAAGVLAVAGFDANGSLELIRRAADGGWGAPQPLALAAADDTLALAPDGSGAVAAIDGQSALWVADLLADGSVRPAQRLAGRAQTGALRGGPVAGAGAAGNAAVATSPDGVHWAVWSRHGPEAAWTKEALPGGAQLRTATALALDESGDALLVGLGTGPATGSRLQLALAYGRPAAGAWQGPAWLSAPVRQPGGVAAALDRQGQAVAAWASVGTVPGRSYVDPVRLEVPGAPFAPATLVRTRSPTGLADLSGSVARVVPNCYFREPCVVLRVRFHTEQRSTILFDVRHHGRCNVRSGPTGSTAKGAHAASLTVLCQGGLAGAYVVRAAAPAEDIVATTARLVR